MVSDGSKEKSCVSITTPTWICRASVGFTGRIITDIRRIIGKGTWLALLLRLGRLQRHADEVCAIVERTMGAGEHGAGQAEHRTVVQEHRAHEGLGTPSPGVA